MNAREIGLNQTKAAYIAEISERNLQRIEAGQHQPNHGKVKSHSSTQYPLGEVWDKELEPMLRKEPRLKPMTLFFVCARHLSRSISPSTTNDSTTSASQDRSTWTESRSNV